MSDKTMSERAYTDAVIHGMHVAASSAKEAAAAAFGRDSAACKRASALTQLLLAMLDGQRVEAEHRVAAFFKADD